MVAKKAMNIGYEVSMLALRATESINTIWTNKAMKTANATEKIL